MIHIKQATIIDLPQLCVLFDAYRQFYKQDAAVDKAKDFLEARIKNKESVIFVALDNEKAVGFTQLYPIFSSVSLKRTWLLNDLYVDPGFRKKGVAFQLLQKAKEHGIKTSSKWLLLQTDAGNDIAQSVYQKDGWSRITDHFFQFNLPPSIS
ncbi:MAG TPA: GNAT family N-acetyltransferase [Flavisolibacter sp.]|nr:GNAT family N-acetyltransferase [Flavisolibacter sp.]